MKRIVFFGTPHFAATILESLLQNGANIVAVVTKPDKPVGRSSTPQPSPVKKSAVKHHIPVYQPLKASTPDFAAELQKLEPDLLVVVAYSEIFKEILLQLPKEDCINVHASLLPKYRGAAPIHRAVMAGEKVSGVTIMSMASELDAGEILGVEKVEIPPEMTTGELFEALAQAGARELWRVLQAFENQQVIRLKQDPSLVTYAPKVSFGEGLVDWKRGAEELHNHIRGMTPKPGAWCWCEVRGEKRRLHLKKTIVKPDISEQPGMIMPGKGFMVACGQGGLELQVVQLEGKKALSASEFLRGISKEELKLL